MTPKTAINLGLYDVSSQVYNERKVLKMIDWSRMPLSSRGVPTIDVVARRLLPHLAGVVFVSHLRQEEDRWAEVARWDAATDEISADPALLPEQSVLDYVASSSKLTYLPQGEEGSEWCLAGARCVLFLPFRDGDRHALLYIAGRTVDAFSVEGVRAAYNEFVNLTSG